MERKEDILCLGYISKTVDSIPGMFDLGLYIRGGEWGEGEEVPLSPIVAGY